MKPRFHKNKRRCFRKKERISSGSHAKCYSLSGNPGVFQIPRLQSCIYKLFTQNSCEKALRARMRHVPIFAQKPVLLRSAKQKMEVVQLSSKSKAIEEPKKWWPTASTTEKERVALQMYSIFLNYKISRLHSFLTRIAVSFLDKAVKLQQPPFSTAPPSSPIPVSFRRRSGSPKAGEKSRRVTN